MNDLQTLLTDIVAPYAEGKRQDELLETFEKFLDMLKQRTREVNLTGIRDTGELAIQVVGDALAPLANAPEDFPEDGPKELLDVGSGAGLPGIVYAIFWPSCEVVLLESQKKRLDFLREAIDQLDLSNCQILEGRAETHAHELVWRERFDMVTSRALAPLPIALELCLPYLALDGWMLTFKGNNPGEEIKDAQFALGKLGASDIDSRAYTPAPGSQRRHALWIRKTGLTPDRYPRREGIPAKRPLRGGKG